MVKTFASVFTVAAAGSAHLKWSDCGDADTFVTIVGLDPEDVALPGKTSLTGSGFLSADEAGGQFKFTAKAAGVQVLSGGGDLCEENTITLPEGGGTIQFHALDCPVKSGQVDVKLDLDLADSFTRANDLINIQLSALSSSGDKLLCMEIETNGLSTSLAGADRPDCSAAACSDSCECSYTTCSDEVDACLADDKCAASQDCAFKCACNDDACLLKCAASSPSLKALPLAKCITTKCSNLAFAEEAMEVNEILQGNHSKDVLVGIVKGLLSDGDEAEMCELDGISAGAMFGAALADLKAGKYVDVATDLGIAFGKVQPLAKDCGAAAGEAVKLAAALKDFSPAVAKANIKAHKTEILEERAAASKCKDSEDWDGYGKHMGAAARHIILTEANTTDDNTTDVNVSVVV